MKKPKIDPDALMILVLAGIMDETPKEIPILLYDGLG